jgi:photosystem II stability/assembly factor-like uncharacterized protein
LLRLKLEGSNSRTPGRGEEPLQGRINYFIGDDPSNWRTNVPTYGRVSFPSVYPGIDLAYYADNHGLEYDLEYDLIIGPGADPHLIRLKCPGAESIHLTVGGDLEIVTPAGRVLMARPQAYQQVAGLREPVVAGYNLKGAEIQFTIGHYDTRLALVIDPVLSYSTLLGGTQQDEAAGIAVDSAGNAYVTGMTSSPDFPLANAYQSSNPFGIAFVSKLNTSGTGLVYSTFIGGSDGSQGVAIAVGPDGSAYVAGNTDSTDFPVVNAFQPKNAGFPDVFVAKLSPTGSSLTYSTYLGGTGLDSAAGLAVDTQGAAYVTGRTGSQDFPTKTPLQGHLAGRFNAFLTKLDASGSSLAYSTYLGGTANDQATSVAVDTQGAAYVGGATSSPDFPTVAAFQSTFQAHTVMKTGSPNGTWSSADAGIPVNAGVLAIKVDPTSPQTLLAGTNGAGLFKSTDGGGSWTAANSSLQLRTVKAIAIDPVDHNTVYAGGSGQIAKSTDGGNSWHASGPGAFFEQLLVYPADHNTVFAGTGNGLFITHDGGSTWSQNSPVGGSGGAALVADPTSPPTVFLGNGRGIFKTTDGGTSWVNLFTSFSAITCISVDPSNHLVMYAGTQGSDILKSTDAGAHWSPESIGVPGALVTAIVISADSSVYIGTLADGILRSSDGGATWQPMSSGLSSPEVMALALNNRGSLPVYEGSLAVSHGFVVKVNATGSAISYSTLLGGESNDFVRGIAVDSGGNVYVSGNTFSRTFPIANAAQPSSGGLNDAFVAKLASSGSALMYSTYLGGSLDDQASSIAIDSGGNVYVAGITFSSDLHVISPVQPVKAGGADAFVARLDSSGTIVYSTYLGGEFDDTVTGIAADSAGAVYVAGSTMSSAFPTTSGALKSTLATQDYEDAFVAKLSQLPVALSISSAAVSGKQLLVFGSGFDDGAAILLEGQQQKTQNDASDPTTKLIAKKGGKKITPGQRVTLQVRDANGATSPPFTFTRPQ